MVALPPDWKTLKNLVEGIESPTSCVFINGAYHYSSAAVAPGTKPTLVPLVDLLRSDMEIPREIRNWIADMILPSTDVLPARQLGWEATCSLSIKRTRGRPRASVTRHADAVDHFRDLFRLKPDRRKQVLYETSQKFGITRSTLEKALREIGEAEEIGRSG